MPVLPYSKPDCSTKQYNEAWSIIFPGYPGCQKNNRENYCCPDGVGDFLECEGGTCETSEESNCNFSFNQSLLKSPLNGTTMSPWVRIAFETNM